SVKELSEIAGQMGGVTACGHVLAPASGSRAQCDVCTSTMWHLFSSAYVCTACNLRVYSSCLRGIRRYCPASYFSATPPTSTIRSLPSYPASSSLGPRNTASPPASPSTVSRESFQTHSSKSDPGSESCRVNSSKSDRSSDSGSLESSVRSPKSFIQSGPAAHKSPLHVLQELAIKAADEGDVRREGKSPASRVVIGRMSVLVTSICPEAGLSAQNFRCAECGQLITYRWAFGCALQLLQFCCRKPLLDLRQLNPQLFTLLQELCEVKKLREDLLLMKQYLCSCRTAVQDRLLHKLASRQHFVDCPHLYSLQDLCDLHAGLLLPQLQAVHNEFDLHIRTQCQACQGRGHICLNCKDKDDILYPFEQRAVQCSACFAVMHSECYIVQRCCAKCEMQGRRGEASIIGALADLAAPVVQKRQQLARNNVC
ncbi:differentially expressed in FDCP 8 homolog B-like, partial [Hyalella azteca]|uniref:Differentially expressed in FDCP 8 homolog B-like n=1 Tax=Hyalella azteca TaxID=294128 RepID=A0A8B7NWX6_HYAAZ